MCVTLKLWQYLQLSVTQQTKLSIHSLHSDAPPTSDLMQETTSPVSPKSGTGTPTAAPAAMRTGARHPGRASWTLSRHCPPHLRHPPSLLTLNCWPWVSDSTPRRRHSVSNIVSCEYWRLRELKSLDRVVDCSGWNMLEHEWVRGRNYIAGLPEPVIAWSICHVFISTNQSTKTRVNNQVHS